MSGHVKPQAKILIVVAVGVIAFFGLRSLAYHGIIKTPGIMKALVPQHFVLPDLKDAQVANVTPVALPNDGPANVQATQIRGAIWEWNAQMGLLFATGGATTTQGSLMAKRNVNLALYRQDDTSKMQEDLIACAKELHDGSQQCSTGANFVVIMGDGSGQFAAAVNPQLAKLGPQYKVKVIGSVGYSRGEDAFLADPAVKKNPQAAKGILVEGVLRDGDWNIAMNWAQANSIPNNPDEKTYDPDALNWVNAPDYNTAAADYVAGKCEDRKVVKDGHPTGATKHVCVTAIVTWTPGDVTAVTQKGGVVKVVSSKQYRSQMPAVILGPGKFFADNRDETTNMLAAIFEGSDQVRAFPVSLHKAAFIAKTVYNDEGDATSHNGDFWFNYFKGVQQTDAQGNRVELGGSAVNGLEDNLILFGIKSGYADNFKATYTIFGNIATQQYPDIFKTTPIPPVGEVEDKSYITNAQAVLSGNGEQAAEADTPSYQQAANSGETIGNRDYHINFQTGSATLTQDGEQVVRELRDSIALTNAFVKIDGYTDNTGSDTINIPLSQSRASAVASYLHRLAPQNFPTGGPNVRFKVDGHGSQNPACPGNATPECKAQNRRVKITLVSGS
jgi:outer membrane protein OmpA-like peptidoglycan-associated protein